MMMRRSASVLLCLGLVCGLGGGAARAEGAPAAAKLEAGAKPAFSSSAALSKPLKGLEGLIEAGPVDEAVRAMIVAQRWDDAWAKLKDASLKGKPHHKFVKAYVAHKRKDYKAALALFGEVLEEDALLFPEYAAQYAMEAAWALEQPAQVLKLAQRAGQEVLDDHGVQLLLVRAHVGMVKGLKADAEDDEAQRVRQEAQRYLKGYVSRHKRRSESAWVASVLGGWQLEAKAWDEALESFEHILSAHPLASEAKEAQRQVDALLPKLSKAKRAAYAKGERERELAWLRASFDRHRSDQVVERAQALLKQKAWAQADAQSCELYYLVGKSFTKLRKHADSAPWYERIIKSCPDEEVLKALYLGGKAYWNSDKHAQALKAFAALWERFPQASTADDAMYYSARIFREQGKEAKAKAMLEQQVKAYPAGDMASDSHWLLVRQRFAKGDYKGVVRYIEQVGDPQEQDLYSQGRLAYFAARAQELGGERAKAEAGYEAVLKRYPLGYYAFMSAQGLGRLAGEVKPGQELCKLRDGKLCDALAEAGAQEGQAALDVEEILRDASARRGAALLGLGLTSQAEREFSKLRGRYKGSPQKLWALAWMLDRAGAYPLSHDIPRRHIEGWQSRYPSFATQLYWEVAYPQPFYGEVAQWAKTRGLNEALIYAIMREESGFNPRIESWANAKGLMQLMDKTAQGVAKSDALDGFSAEQLFDPKVNVRLGSAYVQELSDQLGGNPLLVIAGYNGGYANVKRWLDERGELPLDLWVEDIPYGQTRNYTKRVLTSFWTYAWLYGESKVPGVSFSLKAEAAKREGAKEATETKKKK